jgi:hypothetical protein
MSYELDIEIEIDIEINRVIATGMRIEKNPQHEIRILVWFGSMRRRMTN